MTMRDFWRLAATALVALCLASCGGGGGGSSTGSAGSSSGSGGTTTSGSGGISVTADKSAIKFLGFGGQYIPPQSIHFTLNGGSGTYYGQVVMDRAGTFQAAFNITGDNSAVVTLTPTNAVQSDISGTFQFQLCTDSACNNVVWSDTVPYSVDTFSVGSSGINVTGYEGAALPTQTITVSPLDTTDQLTVSVNVPSGPTGWLTANHGSDGTLQIGISGAGLNAGSYQGYVNVTFAGTADAPVWSIPVYFAVGDGTVAPTASSIDVTVNSSSASLTGSMPVTFNGAQNPAWTASSDSAWLVLGNTSGTGAGTIHYTIDTTKLGNVADWTTVTGNVTISATGITPVTVPVNVNMKLPEIYFASPDTVPAGRATTITIAGRGLAQLSSAGQISLGGVPVAGGTITSDTSAVLNLAAQPTGRSTLAVPNAAGIPATSVTVGAASLNAMSYSFTPGSGEIGASVYDPARGAFYVVNTTQSALQRYVQSGSQWQVSSLPIANLAASMVMAPDGRTLYVVSGQKLLLTVDPDAMTVTNTYTAPDANIDMYLSIADGMAVTSNNRIWFDGGGFTAGLYFDMEQKVFANDNVMIGDPYAVFFPSGDGSVMILVDLGESPQYPFTLYHASSDSLTTSVNPPQLYAPMLNTDGSEFLDVETGLLQNTSTFNVLGNINLSTGLGTRVAMSPDGQRIYQMATASDESFTVTHINVYDAAQAVPGGGSLPIIGQIPVTDQAAVCQTLDPDTCNIEGELTISPLGDTLFWIGNQGLVVFPIPSAMSNVKHTPRLLKAGSR